MVRSRYLTPEHLIKAMKAGDFYASSGVVLRDVQFDKQQRKLSIQIEPSAGVTYETQFVVLPKPKSKPADANDLPKAYMAAKVAGDSPSYTLKSDDYYVRAIVTSSQPHENPSLENQTQQAWTQPVGW